MYMLLFISVGEHKAEEMSRNWSQKMVELRLGTQLYVSHGSSLHWLSLSLRRLLSTEEGNSVETSIV